MPTPEKPKITIDELDALIKSIGYVPQDITLSNIKKYFYKTINGCIIEVSRNKIVPTGSPIYYTAEFAYLRNSTKVTRRISYLFGESVNIVDALKLVEEEVTIVSNRMQKNDLIHQL